MLRTERLLLRRWHADDRAPFAALCADPEVMRFVGDGRPLDAEAADASIERFERHWDEHGFGLWAVEEDGVLRGFCGLAIPAFLPAILPAVEVGWRLERAAWGRGLATEAARAAVAWGFAELGLAQVVAVIAEGNARSERVARKLGAVPGRVYVVPGSGVRARVWRLQEPTGNFAG